MRILVVNDTQEILETFRAVLETEGYEVVLSSFPINRMQEILQIAPDMIILDLLFGGEKQGWQMLQLLKMHRETASIPIILCTAAVNATREMEGYLVSKEVFVVYKPFDIDDLLTTISSAFKSHKHVSSHIDQEAHFKQEKQAD
ncbi:MAG TPA: response regulator [Ktedonobacteraceae bacterium]|nr:response regulator [Ktedonobacteraceae bacterium]